MELLAPDEFVARTRHHWPCQMDVSIYHGVEFDCACGQRHAFAAEQTPVVGELGGMKLVLQCPDGRHVTCVRIHGLFRYRLESLFGTEVPEHLAATPENIAASLPPIGDAGPGPDDGFDARLADDVRNVHTGLPFRVATLPLLAPDGVTYWVTVILGYGQAQTGEVEIQPKMNFTCSSEVEAKNVHAQVVEVLASQPPDRWAGTLPSPFLEGGSTDAVRQMLRDLGALLRGQR